MSSPGRTANRPGVENFVEADGCAPARPAEPAGTGGCLLYQKNNNCIIGAQKRSAYAVETNIVELVKRHGVDRVFEFTVTTPDNCVQHWDFQERWHSLFTNELRKLFVAGVYVKARQERGALHLHAAVVMPFAYRNPSCFPWDEVKHRCYKHVDVRLRRLWSEIRDVLPRYRFGRHTLLPIRKTGLAYGRYLASYYAGNFLQRDERDEGARRWGTWGSAHRCSCTFAFLRSVTRTIVASYAHDLGFRDYGDFRKVLGPKWGRVLFPKHEDGRHFLSREAVRAVAACLRAQFWEDARWLATQFGMFPQFDVEQAVSYCPHLEGLLVW
jgi:hypothetical protein